MLGLVFKTNEQGDELLTIYFKRVIKYVRTCF